MKPAILHTIASALSKDEIRGKDVLEVGSKNVNGSVRPIVMNLKPNSYIGVDIVHGPDVDKICDIQDLITEFGIESFDAVFCTEVLEHIENWVGGIHNLKGVLKPGGILIVSTPSKGFHYHSYPSDFWRYEVMDMQIIFSDMEIVSIFTVHKGVIVRACKPKEFKEIGLDEYKLYSMQTNKAEICGLK